MWSHTIWNGNGDRERNFYATSFPNLLPRVQRDTATATVSDISLFTVCGDA